MGDKAASGRGVLRRILSIFLSIFVVLFTIAASAGLWIQTRILSSESVASSAKVFLADPVVAAKVGEFLTDTTVDIADQVRESSTDRNLARVLSKSLTKENIAPQAAEIASSPLVVDTIAALAESAHSQILDILKGNGDESTTVSLNMVPVVVSVLEQMQVAKIIPESVELPKVTSESTPAESVSAVGKAFKIKLKKDFGQFTVVGGEDGVKVEDIDGKIASEMRILFAILVALVLFVVAVLFAAPTRRAGARIASVAFLLGSLMATLAARIAPDKLVANVDDETNRPVISSIIDSFVSSYVMLTTVMLVLAVLLVVAAFPGPSWLARVRSKN